MSSKQPPSELGGQWPSIDSLRCFVAAAETLNFSAASKRVGLTPTALSQRIRQLEEQVGAALFFRNTRQVLLSPLGEKLLPIAQDTLLHARDFMKARSEQPGQLPELILGTRYELGLSWIVPQLEQWGSAVSASLQLYFGADSDLLQRTEAGTVDATISSSRFSSDKLEAVNLHKEQYTFVAAKTLLQRQAFTGRTDAKHFTLLDLSAELPLFRYLEECSDLSATDFSSVMKVGTIAAIRDCVLEAKGVAVMPHYFVAEDLDEGSLVHLLPDVTLGADFFRLIFRRGHVHREALLQLAACMQSAPLR